jgi:uncharacterized protein (TIGR02001 family)
MFKKTLISGLVATAFVAASALAQTPAAPAAPASPHTFNGNVGLFSQYIFRGLTQTNRKPALQGGFDYSHESGVYIGTWASNISWLNDGGQYKDGGSLEMDIYGGYKGTFGKSDFTYDAGLLYYWYPGTVATPCSYGLTPCPKANTTELYGALGWKFVTLKYSHGIDKKTFGVPNSRNTSYIDLTADVPVGETGLTVNLHYGRQSYKGSNPQYPTAAAPRSNSSVYTYSDWKAGGSYALPKDFTIGVFATGTSGADKVGYGSVGENGVYPRNIAKTTGTVFIKKTF